MRKCFLLALALSVAASAQNTAKTAGPSTLTVITHDSFDLDKKLVAQFETANKTKLRFVKGGDAGQLLNRLILTRKAPLADVVYGLDNSMLARAKENNLLLGYKSPLLSQVPAGLHFGPEALLTPVNYGFVALNYDRAYFEKNKLALPKSLDDLKKAPYAALTVVQSPDSSSPGLAFMQATVNHYGEEGAWAWWREARKNGLKITRGWSEAYYKDFSKNGGKYPIVLSYSSSPAAEVFYADGFNIDKLPAQSPTANLFLPGSVYRQVEGVGILRGAKQPALARKFIDFMLSSAVQSDIPTRMWIYPAVTKTKLSPVFKFAEQPSADLFKTTTSLNAQRLLDQWVQKVWRTP